MPKAKKVCQKLRIMPKVEKVCQMLRKFAEWWERQRKCVKSNWSMRKCAKSWQSVSKTEKVWENLPKAEKVCLRPKKYEKVHQKVRKCPADVKNNYLVRTLSVECCLSLCRMLHWAKLYSDCSWESTSQAQKQFFSAHTISRMLFVHMLDVAFGKTWFRFWWESAQQAE